MGHFVRPDLFLIIFTDPYLMINKKIMLQNYSTVLSRHYKTRVKADYCFQILKKYVK